MPTREARTSCCNDPEPGGTARDGAGASESCCSTPGAEVDSDALEALRRRTTSPEADAVRTAAFWLLLDRGQPVSVATIAVSTNLDEATVEQVVEEGAGRVELDNRGRIVGIAGLTINATRHRVTIESKTRWTWCALDAVGILGALEATGAVRSTDPSTGRPVEIDFVAGEPRGEATLFILGGYDGGNVREEWCPLVNFFSTRGDAETWVAKHDLEGDIVSIGEIAGRAAAVWQLVVDASRPGPE